ncbi:MAG: hypothetical protein JNK23_01875 [Opitutaceae bacterium]|nr:hypothetical protein [Opitutaceae bacterium]
MYHREYPITPSQQAAHGALGIFVEGHRKDDVRQMLVGLSVLRSATAAQIQSAMAAMQAGQRATIVEIEAMLAG